VIEHRHCLIVARQSGKIRGNATQAQHRCKMIRRSGHVLIASERGFAQPDMQLCRVVALFAAAMKLRLPDENLCPQWLFQELANGV
jgi:ribosomal protein L36